MLGAGSGGELCIRRYSTNPLQRRAPTNPTPDTPTPSSLRRELSNRVGQAALIRLEQEAALIKVLSESSASTRPRSRRRLDEIRAAYQAAAARLRWTAIWTRRSSQAL